MSKQPTSLPPFHHMFNQLPGCWGCKDKDSVFVYANNEYSELIGLPDYRDVTGRTDFDMPSPTVECAELFRQQDRQVIESETRLRVLDIHPYSNGRWFAHLFTKTPWYDEKGNLLGTIFCGQELTDTAILEVGQWICRAAGVEPGQQQSFSLDLNRQKVSLSKRESEVLFLHLYGKKPQYIASVLGLSVKTIENHFANLRIKFSAHSKRELIDRALELGFGSHIPESLLNTQLSVVLKD